MKLTTPAPFHTLVGCMRGYFALIASIVIGSSAWADAMMPLAKGATWLYKRTQEFGEGVHPSADANSKFDADGKLRLPPPKANLELAELPQIGEQPAIAATPVEKKMLTVVLASELTGETQTSFPSDTPELYLRWQGETLNPGDKIRCVWIAEDVGDAAPANYQVNEASTKAQETRGFGTFTLSRPNKGWPTGKYRAEIYVGDKLAETVKFTIEKPEP